MPMTTFAPTPSHHQAVAHETAARSDAPPTHAARRAPTAKVRTPSREARKPSSSSSSGAAPILNTSKVEPFESLLMSSWHQRKPLPCYHLSLHILVYMISLHDHLFIYHRLQLSIYDLLMSIIACVVPSHRSTYLLPCAMDMCYLTGRVGVVVVVSV